MGLAGEWPAQLSDQTILNNEAGQRNPGICTLVRHCQMLDTTLLEVMKPIAESGWFPSCRCQSTV